MSKKVPPLQRFLKSLATLQHDYTYYFLAFFIILSIVLFSGLSNLAFESDMMNEMPQDLPIFQLNDRVSSSFGGQDIILVLFQIDDSLMECRGLDDIRDPKVIEYLYYLESELSKKSDVESVTSLGSFFEQPIKAGILSEEYIGGILDQVPSASQFISEDYTSTILMIKADVGSDEKTLQSIELTIDNAIASIPSVPGLKSTVTGTPSLMQTMISLLKSDSLFTLSLAAFIIFLFLILMERSFTKALLVFVPLIFGVFWTIGFMGWVNLKISIATAGLGAMLLGLAVEYGVFIVTRYYEERKQKVSQRRAMQTALPGVGSAMIGSSLTTIAGFLALSLSIIPMMQHLGQSLAIGIAFCLIAAIGFSPIVILLEERFEHYTTKRQLKKYSKKHDLHKGLKK